MRVESLKANLLATALREGKWRDCRIILSWIITCFLTYCMEQSRSWEANLLSAIQEIPRIFLNPVRSLRIHKCPSTVPILSQLDPVHTLTSHCLTIHLLISFHLCPGLPSSFPTKTLYTPLETCYMHRLSHSSRLYYPNRIWWGVQIIKLLII
jgi:hypothetical protein